MNEPAIMKGSAMRGHRHPVNVELVDRRTRLYERVDKVLRGFGSVQFVMWQTIAIILWITLNFTAFVYHWDPYPFILLNLVFSTQAAYAAPLILLSQNRSADRDRLDAEHDYMTDTETFELLKQLHSDHSAMAAEHSEMLRELSRLILLRGGEN